MNNNIDLNIWCSQTYLSKKLGTTPQRVHNWAKRGRLDSMYVKELCMPLVRNINSINELRSSEKNIKKK